MTEATSCLLALAPTPQLGNKSPPVSCDPCRISSSPACSLSPRRLVRALTRSSRTPHQGQEKCLQSRGAAGGAPARGAGPSWRRPRGSPGHKPGRSGAGGEPERDGKGTDCARRREAREARRDEARRSDERPGSEDRQTKPEADAAPGALRPGQASVAATASFPEKVAS